LKFENEFYNEKLKILDNKKFNCILAIETSGKVCGIALIVIPNNYNELPESTIVAEYNIYEGNKHDKFTAELCKRIVEDFGLNFNELSAVAVSIGPGSFTGLRIGTAIAKSLCFDDSFCQKFDENYLSNQTKLLTVPTLQALADNAINFLNSTKLNRINDFQILSIIPSHANLVYHQLFNNMNETLTNIGFSEVNEIENLYKNSKNIFVTSNQELNSELFKNSPNEIQIIPELTKMRASIIANYAVKLFKQNIFTDSTELVPLYIQEFIPKQ
jgi:tRNA threonylcarbamoyladenosine biosynthesis protein TsaB